MSKDTVEQKLPKEILEVPEPQKIVTSAGTLSYTSVGTGSPTLLLIHGNSFCSKIWKYILGSELSKTNRIVAFDLPGHGESADASDPSEIYNQPGYAKVAVALLQKLDITEVIVFGWSLGGHIGMEMLPLFPGVKGLMIVGTPPVRPEDLNTAFTFGELGWQGAFAARDNLSADEISNFALNCADKPYEDWMRDCVARTDQKARKMMFHHFASPEATDQKRIVKETKVLTAVVNGAQEPFINLKFITDLEFGNLWEGRCHELDGFYHAPFWADPAGFQVILERFIRDCR